MSTRDEVSSPDDGLAGPHLLLWQMIRKEFLLMIRYPVNLAFRLLGMYLFFIALFFGGRVVVGQAAGGAGAFGETFEGIIVGWFLWTMALISYQTLHSTVTAESQWGTLEQLFMSPYGFNSVMGLKLIVNVLLAFLWGFVMLLLMMVTSGRWLAVDLLTVVPIAIFTLMTALGIGFIIGGLALVYKKISSINSIMQFVIVGLIAAPITELQIVRFLPLAQGSAMLQDAMREGTTLLSFPATDLAILAGTGIGYFVVGFAVFHYMGKVARKRGVMGHY